MIEVAALRYHPIRMRWLYEESDYSRIAKRYDAHSKHIYETQGHVNPLGSIHYGDRKVGEDTADRFEGVEAAYLAWRNSEMARIFDLSNVAHLIPDLNENDDRWIAEAKVFEDDAYIHFGRPIHGYDGFYVGYDEDKGQLRYTLVHGGTCDPNLDPISAAETFTDVVYDFIISSERLQDKAKTRSEEIDPSRAEEIAKAILHVAATLRFLATHYDSFLSVWPSDTPALLARKQELLQRKSYQQTAEDVLWYRGWSQVEVMPLPHEPGYRPCLQWERLNTPAERLSEFHRYARHVIAQERGCALTGENEIHTAYDLAYLLEHVFSLGATKSDDPSAFDDNPEKSEAAAAAEDALSIATYGKSPHAPVLQARYYRKTGGRWELQISGETIEVASVSDQVIDELASAGLVRLVGNEAYPSELLKDRHMHWTTSSRSAEYGQFNWG